jgi:uncharacterized protein (TIGR02646 family)
MVTIKKKATDTPSILKTKGKAETDKLKKMSVAQRLAYKYSSDIYGDKTVKDKLKKLQHDKCCFCESRVSASSHGDVEHYRPKGGWIQKEGDALTQPGYYWLAFEFSNLFLSCQICNQTFKKNYFPLSNPAKRTKTHTQKLSAERPLIIDPGKTNPSAHLEFRQEMVHAKTNMGGETIKRTGLNREKLVQERFDHLKLLTLLAKLASQNNSDGKEARKQFKELASDKSVYSLMVRDNFPHLL